MSHLVQKSLILGLPLALSTFAHADTSSQKNEEKELGVVVVTSRGVAEKSTDAPLSVSVISGADIEKRQFTTVQDSLRSIPGLDIHDGGDAGLNYMWIRGVGAVSHTSIDDNSVGVLVDGASQGIIGLTNNLYDVEQIEVTKGPQGTLFGSSSEAGTVNIKTNNPEPFFGANLETGYASNNQRTIKAMINTPLSDTLAFRLATMSQWQDNYVRERTTDSALNAQKNQGLRGKLRWTPNGKTDVMFTAHHNKLVNFLPMVMMAPFGGNNSYLTTGNIPHFAERTTSGANIDVNYQWDNVQLHSTTSYLHHTGDSSRALYALEYIKVAMPAMLSHFQNPANNLNTQNEKNNNIEQEFRFSALPGNPVQWVGGAYFSHTDRDFDYAWTGQGAYQRNYVTDTQALFGEVTLPVTKQLKSITGLRLSREQTSYKANYVNGATQHSDQQKISDTTFTGRLGLDYAFNPVWHTYGMYSRGHKPAGFNDYGNNVASGLQDTPYNAGHIDTFELGLKGSDPDGKWSMALALYTNKIKNDKLSVYELPSYLTRVFNVDTKSNGIELSGFAQVHPRVRVNGSMSYIDATITSTPSAASTNNDTQSGNRIPEVPHFSASFGLEYRQPLQIASLNNAQFYANTNARYVGDRPAQPNNKLTLKSYTLLDVAAGVQNAHHEVSVWVKNLTDRKYMTYAMLQGNYELGIQAQGRSMGINYRYSY
jgi:iron complex outermembrane receptor protein